MDDGVLVSRHGTVLHVQLHAPRTRNALSRTVLSALGSAFDASDHSTTGIVLSGTGDSFSSGADFRELTGTSADLQYDEAVAAVTKKIRELPVVVVAAIEGPCIGAAADVALSCDLRVAAEGSYLQVPAVQLGILYNPATVDRLRRSLPRDTVRRLLLLGERFHRHEAHRAGLVSHVVPRGEAVNRAVDLLATTTTEHLDALGATKGLLDAQESGGYDLSEWEERRTRLLDSPTRKNAIESAKRTHTERELKNP